MSGWPMVAVTLLTISSNGLDETTLNLWTRISIVDISIPSNSSNNRGALILRALLSARPGVRSAFVNVRGGGAVDQETEQFRPAVGAAGVHHLLAFVDQREVEVGDEGAFPRPDGLPQQGSIGCHDRGEATAG